MFVIGNASSHVGDVKSRFCQLGRAVLVERGAIERRGSAARIYASDTTILPALVVFVIGNASSHVGDVK